MRKSNPAKIGGKTTLETLRIMNHVQAIHQQKDNMVNIFAEGDWVSRLSSEKGFHSESLEKKIQKIL
jgi:hypothetical protein